MSNSYIEYKNNGDINKTLSVEEYCNKIRPYLKGIINNHEKFDTWKIQLTNNFVTSKDNVKKHVMHSKSDNIEIMISDGADEVIKEIFDSLKNRYQNKVVSLSLIIFI